MPLSGRHSIADQDKTGWPDFLQYLSQKQNKLKKNKTRNKDMKPTSHLKSVVTQVTCGLVLAASLAIGLTSQIASGQGNPNPGVIPPQARPYGLSYGEWGAQWWRWAYSFPVAQFPPLQSGDLDCAAGQSGPV